MATVDDGGINHVVSPQQVSPISADGDVNFEIIPNDVLAPTGTAYIIEYILSCQVRYREVWQVDSGGANPIDIGDVPRLTPPIDPTGSMSLGALTNVLLTDPTNGEVLYYDNGIWKNGASGGGTTTLAALTDTDIQSVADLDYLVYNEGLSKWVNRPLVLPSYASLALPVAGETYLNQMAVVKDAGAPSQVVVCLEYSTPGSYGWWPLASTP
jgi:hypothetical protein